MDINAVYEDVQQGVREMRDRIDSIERKYDGLQANEIESINAKLGEMQKQLDDHAQRSAGHLVGGASGEVGAQHRKLFREFMAGRYSIGDIRALGSTFSGPDGGFLAPNTVDLAVTRVLERSVAMRRLANIVTGTASSYTVFRSLGGMQARWSAENGPGGETNTPTLAMIDIKPGKLEAEPRTTIELVQDALIDVEAWYANEIAVSF
ncbi:MAG: phage major capsid protein, partial [Sphingomonadaceae bacterium]